MKYYTDAEIVVHHITALIASNSGSWYIGRRLDDPIPADELPRVQELVYYPCDWDTATEVFKFMVDEYEVQPDLWWNANSGALIYVYKAAGS